MTARGPCRGDGVELALYFGSTGIRRRALKLKRGLSTASPPRRESSEREPRLLAPESASYKVRVFTI